MNTHSKLPSLATVLLWIGVLHGQPVVYRTAQGGIAIKTSRTATPVTSAAAPSGTGFVGDPASTMDTSGRLVVVARDANNKFWINSFAGGTWQSWIDTTGVGQGTAALAVATDGTVYIAVRAFDNTYYMASYSHTAGTM